MNMMKYLITLLVLLVVLAGVPTTSANSNPAVWASWVFQMDFLGNQIQGDLIITIEYEDRKREPIVEIIQLECTPVGTLAIAGEQATFSGDDYIRCAMPDLVQLVAQLTHNNVILSPVCFCKESPWVEANLSLETTPNQPEPLNPVFYRPDLQFSTPLVNKDRAAMLFQVDNRAAQSTSFLLGSSSSESLWAEYSQTATDIFNPIFIANGSHLSSTPAVISSPLALSNGSTYLYIGYSPANGSYLEGTIITLRVDPACRGFG
jgi:hypothetical protein